ncbi:MAG TPA: ATP-binding protein [Syntrophomonadaceae bacterium]|nr:ATP-binding protein [Syntrophomonadaceae bacterium]
MKNIFLTGPIQVGKTTIIRSSLSGFAGTIRGFYTQPFFPDNGQLRFVMRAVNSEDNCKQDAWICQAGKNKQYIAVTETFETTGVDLLQKALTKDTDLIIMDELGFFESEATRFQVMVKKCLVSPIPVLGVLKQKSTPFLDEIRYREDILLLSVSEQNRDHMAGLVKMKLQELFDRA